MLAVVHVAVDDAPGNVAASRLPVPGVAGALTRLLAPQVVDDPRAVTNSSAVAIEHLVTPSSCPVFHWRLTHSNVADHARCAG
jgi:hypothetical protein